MSAAQDSYYNLVERIEDAFPEIDSAIVSDLASANEKYAALREEISKLQKDYPTIVKVAEGSGAVNLSAEEHEALTRYFDVKSGMEDLERRQIYFRGHTDNFAYLKKIGAI